MQKYKKKINLLIEVTADVKVTEEEIILSFPDFVNGKKYNVRFE